jgi:glycolate oxidase FAD binding subunit
VSDVLRPAVDWELASVISDAAERGWPLEISGSGSKRGIGRPMQTAAEVTTRAMRGVTLYEPSELVMSARAGTLVAEIEAELAKHGQMLAFEPLDLGALFSGQPGQGTIGAVFATNLSGARRISAGAARDHLLGLKAVTGRGESIKSGGRVMKNVTGYDVGRGLAGSWGTLAVMTEVTFKVLPVPEAIATLILSGLPDEIGVEVLCSALGTPYEVSGAVHLQQGPAGRLWHSALKSLGTSVTALRIETFASSVAYRTEKLKTLLQPYGEIHVLDTPASQAFWDEMRQLSVLTDSTVPLWRISTEPRSGPKVVAAIAQYMPVEAVYDWSGGLVWLLVPASADAGATDVRRVIALHGGHATLIRAEAPVRASIDVFQPLDAAVERLTRRLKASFDPAGILNRGRMYATL